MRYFQTSGLRGVSPRQEHYGVCPETKRSTGSQRRLPLAGALAALGLLALTALGAAKSDNKAQPQPTPVSPTSPGTSPEITPLALYRFDEGAGGVVRDHSPMGPPLDLVIDAPGQTRWLGCQGLALTGRAALISSSIPAAKISRAVRSTGEMSVEAWVRPTTQGQHGPGRIVTLSSGPDARNFSVEQVNSKYEARVRSSKSSPNSAADSARNSGKGPIRAGKLDHLVFTRESSGRTLIYIDGELSATGSADGTLDSWEDGFHLGLGNEFNQDRCWTGEYYQVAIYDRALNADQVRASFAKGLPAAAAPSACVSISASPTTGTAPLRVGLCAQTTSTCMGEPIATVWSFDDGTSASGTQVEHTYAQPGNYAVTVESRFDSGEATSASLPIEVKSSNTAPVASNAQISLNEDSSVSVRLGASDAQQDQLTYIVTAQPEHGTLSGQAPELVYTPQADWYGTDRLAFRAEDGFLSSEEAYVTLNVQPVNDAPVAFDQWVETGEDTALPVTLRAVDVESQELQYRITVPPAHGTLTGEGSQLYYAPAADYYGPDAFEYVANDGVSDSSPSAVAITVLAVNDPPQLEAQDLTVQEYSGYHVVPGWVRAAAGPENEQRDQQLTVSISRVEHPELFDLLPQVDPAGTLSFSLAPGRHGQTSIELVAKDGGGSDLGGTDSATATVTLVVNPLPVNRAPSVELGPDRTFDDVNAWCQLDGVVRDDGLPVTSTLSVQWSKVFGPGEVVFESCASASTRVLFSSPGIYRLRLDASDSEYSAADCVDVRAGMICNVQAPQGLVALWPGNGSAQESVQGNDAILAKGAFLGAGLVSQAFSFDGVDDYALAPANESMDFANTQGFSVEFWMKPDALASKPVLAWSNGTSRGVHLWVNAYGTGIDAHMVDARTPSTRRTLSTPNNLVDAANWHHVALTFDKASGVTCVYVDGVLRVSANMGSQFMPLTSGDLYFGFDPIDTTCKYYQGGLDEISLYGRALDGQEIADIFVAGSAGKCPVDSNAAPSVDAGPDLSVETGTSVTLRGSVVDDGQPQSGKLRCAWRALSGPAPVRFANPQAAQTEAMFDAPGLYLLELTASDGIISVCDRVEVRADTLYSAEDPEGLLAWWPVNNSGQDVMGGSELRLMNVARFASAKVLYGLQFDGVNDYASAATTSSLVLGQGEGFTAEFWMKQSANVSKPLIVWSTGTGRGVHVWVNYYGTGIDAHMVDVKTPTSRTTVGTANGVLDSTNWHHVALTFEKATGATCVYVDGVLRGSMNLGNNFTPLTAGNLYLGFDPGEPAAKFFGGMLDEISLYDRALGSEEVWSVFSAGATGKCPVSANTAPVVEAGANLTGGVGQELSLKGSVSDDGLPREGVLWTKWSLRDGPGQVSFADASAPQTGVTFSAAGIYILELAASDGELVSSDTLEVRIDVPCLSGDFAALTAWWAGNASTRDVLGGNPVQLVNGASFLPGRVSMGFALDGVNDFLRAPASQALDLGSREGFTAEFWMKQSANVSKPLMVWSTGTGRGVHVWVNAYGTGIDAHMVNAKTPTLRTTVGTANGLLDTANWHHVALTFAKSTGVACVYVDGSLRGTVNLGTTFVPLTSGNLYLGFDPGESAAKYFGGRLDEVSLYGRAFGAGEIAAIYSSGAAGKCVVP